MADPRNGLYAHLHLEDDTPQPDANEIRPQIAERENKQLRARLRSLEGALRVIHKTSQPYAANPNKR
jgi:hypothetical protein